MKTCLIIALTAALLASATGCATKALWTTYDPNERLFIDHAQVSEQQLRKKGVKFTRVQNGTWDGYLVEKSQVRKLGDVVIRTFGTAITLVIDTTKTVVITGALLIIEQTPELLIEGAFN